MLIENVVCKTYLLGHSNVTKNNKNKAISTIYPHIYKLLLYLPTISNIGSNILVPNIIIQLSILSLYN